MFPCHVTDSERAGVVAVNDTDDQHGDNVIVLSIHE